MTNCPFCNSPENSLEKCTCGSGGHPRQCKRHPWGYANHVNEMNSETSESYYDAYWDFVDILSLIAAPARPDGTFNRDREACQKLAADILKKHN